MRIGLAILLTALALPAPAFAAEEAPQNCPDKPVLSAELAGWGTSVARKTMKAHDQATIAGWSPVAETRSALSLHPIAKVTFAMPPGKAILAHTYGGIIPVRIARAGRVRIAMSDAVWIDLVRDGKARVSTGHGHGPACSGIRKIVDFDVTPGLYLLQIANAPRSAVGAMVILPR